MYGMASFIYAIGPEPDLLKIGYSQDVAKRLSQLQVGIPYELRVYHTESVPFGAAPFLEREIHKRFKVAHRRGEWFSVAVEDVIKAIDELRDRAIKQCTETGRWGDWLDELCRKYEMHKWSRQALDAYRLAKRGHSRIELERMNSVILSAVGVTGLIAFKEAVDCGASVASRFYRHPKALRVTMEKLRDATNALARYHNGEREEKLLDEILKIEA